MARTTPQELKTGTLWPQWAQGELFRLAVLKHARASGSCHFSNTRLLTGHRTSRPITVHNGFIPSPVTTRKKDRKAETKSVGCETAPGCPFQLVIARSKTSHSHQFYTEQSNLDHNHALWSWDGLEQAKAEQGRLQEEVKKTVAALKAKAQDELKNLRKSADVFACSTVPADPNELSPTSEQECTIQDVGDALGADIGRRFEQEMRELGLLADDYPVSPDHRIGSSIPADAVPHEVLVDLRRDRAPDRNAAVEESAGGSDSSGSRHLVAGRGRSRRIRTEPFAQIAGEQEQVGRDEPVVVRRR
jgi:hypothetical protein